MPKKVVEITPAAGADALSSLTVGGYFSRTIPPAGLQGEALATQIASEIGGAKNKKVSVGAFKNLYGSDLVQSFSNAWRKRGGKISARVIYEQNLPGLQEAGERARRGQSDAYVFFDFQENYTRVATDLIKTHKWKASQSFGTDSLAISTLGQSGGAAVEGLRGSCPELSPSRFGKRRSTASGKRALRRGTASPSTRRLSMRSCSATSPRSRRERRKARR